MLTWQRNGSLIPESYVNSRSNEKCRSRNTSHNNDLGSHQCKEGRRRNNDLGWQYNKDFCDVEWRTPLKCRCAAVVPCGSYHTAVRSTAMIIRTLRLNVIWINSPKGKADVGGPRKRRRGRDEVGTGERPKPWSGEDENIQESFCAPTDGLKSGTPFFQHCCKTSKARFLFKHVLRTPTTYFSHIQKQHTLT